MKRSLELAEKLIRQSYLEKNEYIELLSAYKDEKIVICLGQEAGRLREKYYGNKVYMRGLIEFTNFCKNNCYYCGIRRDNKNASRYRLTEEEILDCCKNGYELGFRTFVLQGGEDPYFTDDKIVEIVKKIRSAYPDLSLIHICSPCIKGKELRRRRILTGCISIFPACIYRSGKKGIYNRAYGSRCCYQNCILRTMLWRRRYTLQQWIKYPSYNQKLPEQGRQQARKWPDVCSSLNGCTFYCSNRSKRRYPYTSYRLRLLG